MARMTVLHKAGSYLSLFMAAHVQNKQLFLIEIGRFMLISIDYVNELFYWLHHFCNKQHIPV